MKEIYTRIFEKMRNKQFIVIIFIIGIVLMLAAGSFTGEKPKKTELEIDSDQYCRDLEDRLARLLSKMEGVGEVYVMITLENRNAVDISVKNQSGEAVLKRTGSTEEPVITRELYPVIKGVVIAAQGASDEGIAEKIYYAAKAALDIGGSRIAVIEAKKGS